MFTYWFLLLRVTVFVLAKLFNIEGDVSDIARLLLSAFIVASDNDGMFWTKYRRNM